MQKRTRWDHDLIFDLIPAGSSVLDLGCGNGELLARLVEEKQVRGQAVEADPDQVMAAIHNGVAVYQGDLDRGLAEFNSKSFDYVVVEKTLQALRRPLFVLEEILRVGEVCIVSFPNFSYHEVVKMLVETGRMPVSASLPYQWHDTPNIHLFTLLDFLDWVEKQEVTVVSGYAWGAFGYRNLVLPEDITGAEELLFVMRQTPEHDARS
ncbi:MAG TPA: methionine biosynthesis protein MetW [Candidatus Limnocylindrales bacterium]|nr:methionine biosynthesis protein MetW [Candidatus Limnocylindrales bacterium]